MMMPMQIGFADHTDASTTLPRSFTPGWGLSARCPTPGCGGSAVIDPSAWLAQGLAGTPLARLETRLRCICGSRRANLGIEPSPAAPGTRLSIYIFR